MKLPEMFPFGVTQTIVRATQQPEGHVCIQHVGDRKGTGKDEE
jgi:hypothetical protein